MHEYFGLSGIPYHFKLRNSAYTDSKLTLHASACGPPLKMAKVVLNTAAFCLLAGV
jgi:hypothetical protein